MKLSVWAKLQGVTYHTAWNWVNQGRMPVPFERAPTGTILVKAEATPVKQEKQTVIYARVSGSDQKADLDRQVARLMSFAEQSNLAVNRVITEVGSGLNGHRPKLLHLLKDKTASIILVEHRDRLMRFGSEYVEASLQAEDRSLLIAEADELQNDLVQDMIEVMTSFCARLYGKRSAKNKAQLALKAMQAE